MLISKYILVFIFAVCNVYASKYTKLVESSSDDDNDNDNDVETSQPSFNDRIALFDYHELINEVKARNEEWSNKTFANSDMLVNEYTVPGITKCTVESKVTDSEGVERAKLSLARESKKPKRLCRSECTDSAGPLQKNSLLEVSDDEIPMVAPPKEPVTLVIAEDIFSALIRLRSSDKHLLVLRLLNKKCKLITDQQIGMILRKTALALPSGPFAANQRLPELARLMSVFDPRVYPDVHSQVFSALINGQFWASPMVQYQSLMRILHPHSPLTPDPFAVNYEQDLLGYRFRLVEAMITERPELVEVAYYMASRRDAKALLLKAPAAASLVSKLKLQLYDRLLKVLIFFAVVLFFGLPLGAYLGSNH